MREATRGGGPRRSVGHGVVAAGVGWLVLSLGGCVPAAVRTGTYIDKTTHADTPAPLAAPSADPSQTDARPLLTTKNYRDPTEGGHGSTQVYRATPDQVWGAALTALRQLQANVTSNTRTQAGGEIEGQWGGGQPLALHVEQIDPKAIRVTIRVGPVGDRTAEDAIHAAIRGNL